MSEQSIWFTVGSLTRQLRWIFKHVCTRAAAIFGRARGDHALPSSGSNKCGPTVVMQLGSPVSEQSIFKAKKAVGQQRQKKGLRLCSLQCILTVSMHMGINFVFAIACKLSVNVAMVHGASQHHCRDDCKRSFINMPPSKVVCLQQRLQQTASNMGYYLPDDVIKEGNKTCKSRTSFMCTQG